MKIHQTFCLVTALVITPLALAKLPFSNEAFGKVEGTLDFCAQTDTASAPKYQERKKILVKDLPEKEVAEARASQEYLDAHQEMTTELEKLPKEKVVEACTTYLKSDK
jgi:hypothetical protein